VAILISLMRTVSLASQAASQGINSAIIANDFIWHHLFCSLNRKLRVVGLFARYLLKNNGFSMIP